MKKIFTSTALVALLLTGVHADFNFGDVFKEMKTTSAEKVKAPSTDFVFGDLFKELKITAGETAKAPNEDFVFGDVFKDLKQS